MPNPAEPHKIGGPKSEDSKRSGLVFDVQRYLNAKYREALKSGDKSFANSCLLSTRLLSGSSLSTPDEEQLIAKSDGDVGEAAKYFSKIFEQLFADQAIAKDILANETMVVANQMKEELRLLLTELKIQTLKLKSTPDPINPFNLRQTPPISSPRSRMSSEDRSLMSRDSMQKLDSHLISHKRSCFYQDLFENLSPETRRNIIEHSIVNCDSPFERCRLMMLSITLTTDCVKTYGPKLIRTLIELTETSSSDRTAATSDKTHQRTARAMSMCQYAKSMLVLDAIPLIFSQPDSKNLDIDIDELINISLRYYAEFCLNGAASEFDLEELHESVRKSLASIDPLKPTSLEDNLEERVNLSLNLLFEKFMGEFVNDEQAYKVFAKIRETVVRHGSSSSAFASLSQLLPELKLDLEIPEELLSTMARKDLDAQKSQPSTTGTCAKGRGRSKKAQSTSVIVSPDNALKQHLLSATRQTVLFFNSYIQVFFIQSSQYLKWTRCMLPIDNRNPLAKSIEAELIKNQRPTRKSNSDTANPAKKHKGEVQEPDEGVEIQPNYILSLPDSQGSRLKDAYRRLMHDTTQFMDKCELWFEIINKPDSLAKQNIAKLWRQFNSGSSCMDDMKWMKRIQADRLLFRGCHEEALQVLRGNMASERRDYIKKEDASDERVLTVPMSSGPSSTFDVALLRATAQIVYAYVQLEDRHNALGAIADLLAKIKQTGLVVSAEDGSHEMTLDSFGIYDHEMKAGQGDDRNLEYPLLTVPSLVFYCVRMLMDILHCYITHPNATTDLTIGHAIVLSQASWPRYGAIYDRCIDWIRSSKPKSTTPQSVSASTKFTYPDFFYFVQDPNILEDFMALLNDGYTLDIKSNQSSNSSSVGGSGVGTVSGARTSGATSTRSGKAITTRGVNKSFKEELKVALVAQMKHSCAPVPLDLIIEFIQTPLIPFLLAEIQIK